MLTTYDLHLQRLERAALAADEPPFDCDDSCPACAEAARDIAKLEVAIANARRTLALHSE